MVGKQAFFRSAEMSLVQLYIATEVGREVVAALGELGSLQFRDLNADVNSFQRTFVKEIRRLDNVERQLRFFNAQIEKADIKVKKIVGYANVTAAPHATEIDQLAFRTDDLEERINQLLESNERLLQKQVELTELRHVLVEAGAFFDRAHAVPEELRASLDNDDAPLLNTDVEQGDVSNRPAFSNMNIGFVAGVIPREKMSTFERILWRSLRGNLFLNSTEIAETIKDPKSDEAIEKNVFVVFAHGAGIISKIRKIAESLDADLYSVDEDAAIRRDQIHEVNGSINDVDEVLMTTQSTLQTELQAIAEQIASWMVVVKKEKAIYAALNLFNYDQSRKSLIAEGWCATDELPMVKNTLAEVTERAGLQVPSILNELSTTKTPPTYYKTNKFTESFQNIIDAYGISQYREVNPGLPAIITFPFMFAIMFGDLGHGAIMFLAGLAMVIYEKRLMVAERDEIFDMAFTGRYIILLMGAFSMYTGVIYNDIFSKSMTIFKPGWEWPYTWNEGDLIMANSTGVYPFGIDPTWHGADNNLIFNNSYKMKLSIVMGFCHMLYSLFFSLVNYRFYKSKIDVFGNFVPGFLFLVSIFGYLSFIIVFKWAVDWYGLGKPAPGLLNTLIDMFLSPGNVTDLLYEGQPTVQVALVLLAVFCVPWLLLLKPLYLRYENNQKLKHGYENVSEQQQQVTRLSFDEEAVEATATAVAVEEMSEEHEFEFGDVMIHQVIHTIEFCLNCVSHTASYLRLWALSLAHAQLSSVLWTMTFERAFKMEGGLGVIMAFILFAAWFALTIAVLVIMEGTSAMLHSLRLHWVEAMSKHFIGDGIPFTPFSFKAVLEDPQQ
ncbi:V-type ATPase, V0 complex, 116kDa subunit family [Limtongia smithiae]|uniref:V-type ATPase, V0 complex, 116kDa subunit family n=1 Tax=Limtongia smithiae TaxID=1125753 RepID=UPI0034CD8ABB